MARPGIFDTDGVPWGWFDTCGQDQGWFDRDLLTYPAVVPPPPPPPPPPRPRPRPSGGGGGGGGFVPDGLCPPSYYLPEPECEEDPGCDVDADYAIVHITEGATVRAMAAGVVDRLVDGKGRDSVVVTADDGTRYWYADVSEALVKTGSRVRRGQPIARAKEDNPTVPTITPSDARRAALLGPVRSPETPDAPVLAGSRDGAPPAALPPKSPKRPPAQVVFVESPPEPESPPMPPPRAPPVRLFKLVKLPPANETHRPPPPPPPSTGAVILRAAARVGVIAAILYALSFLIPKKKRSPPPRPKRTKRPKRRTTGRQR